MHDVLEELTNLYLQLQERFCTITRADKLIKRTFRVVGKLKQKPGEKEREAAEASVSMNYHGITLTNNKRIISIDRLQFIASNMYNPESRCLAMVTNSIKQTVRNKKEIYEQILADFVILNPDTRPEGDEKDLRYGVENIKNMCSRFRLENVR
jgi:hypothetical protein